MKYVFYGDPGHGWLHVPRSEVNALGIGQNISSYSYQRNEWVYLEEDCDAALFIDAARGYLSRREWWDARTKESICDGRSKIRSYEDYAPDAEGEAMKNELGYEYAEVYLPTKVELERFAGKALTQEQFDDATGYIEKGIEAQLDWHILKTCALQEIGVIE